MKPNKKSPLHEAAQTSGLAAATEQAGIEVVNLIDFIQDNNPGIDRTTATVTAVFYLHHLPDLFLKHPEMMQQLRAIALGLSQK
jgi:hypothetical protein